MRPVGPRQEWSADLSRVELFRSALEDLAHTPGQGVAPQASQTDERPAHELPVDELPAEASRTGDLPAVEVSDDDMPHDGVSHAEAPDDGSPPTDDLTPPRPAPASPPPATPLERSPSGDVDTSLPPSVARPGFGRAPAQRLAGALAQGEDPERREDEEPLRREDGEPLPGTVAPVLRRSTERVRHPTSTTPVIRPPVMPPPPSEAPPAPMRQRTVSWDQALARDVLPQGKKRNKRRQGRRPSKARHESGGVGEYRPKVAADRSLTLLVITMLLVLAALVATAVWTFWPRVSGATGSLPLLGVPRAVGGP